MSSNITLTTSQLAEVDRRLRDGVSAARIARDTGVRRSELYAAVLRSGYRIVVQNGIRQLEQSVPADVAAQPFTAQPLQQAA